MEIRVQKKENVSGYFVVLVSYRNAPKTAVLGRFEFGRSKLGVWSEQTRSLPGVNSEPGRSKFLLYFVRTEM